MWPLLLVLLSLPHLSVQANTDTSNNWKLCRSQTQHSFNVSTAAGIEARHFARGADPWSVWLLPRMCTVSVPGSRAVIASAVKSENVDGDGDIVTYTSFLRVLRAFSPLSSPYPATVMSPFGDYVVSISHPKPEYTVHCSSGLDGRQAILLTASLALTGCSAALAEYDAMATFCAAAIGVLVGVLIPLLHFLSSNTKTVLFAGGSGLMSYVLLNYWSTLLFNPYAIGYFGFAGIIGTWYFGQRFRENAWQVNLSLTLLGVISSVFLTNDLRVNLCVLAAGLALRLAMWARLFHRIWSPIWRTLYYRMYHEMLGMRPKKEMLSQAEYEAQSRNATREALKELRINYVRQSGWENEFPTGSSTPTRIRHFLATGDDLDRRHLFSDYGRATITSRPPVSSGRNSCGGGSNENSLMSSRRGSRRRDSGAYVDPSLLE